MALNQSGELKKRAWLAKQRLKMGYWESVRRDECASEQDSERQSAVDGRMQIVRDPLIDKRVSALDEKMYRKVCEILDRDEATINPIGQLIDDELYNKLDPASRGRYILELSNKFRELKDRYYRERTGS